MKGIIKLPVVPCRAEPSDKSEMTNELLFGETYEVLEKKEKWVLIRSDHDSYEAWIDKKQHAEQETSLDKTLTKFRIPYLYNRAHIDGQEIILPFASLIDEKNVETDSFPPAQHRPKTLLESAKLYMGSPYRWGGRTPLGIDCSGFVQNIFLLHDIKLPRDAWQQAEMGETVNFVEEAATGDLAFFDNAEGNIIHVGMVIDEGDKKKIIHASGKVRIDELDHEGIYIADKGEYSHKLRIIRHLV